MAAQWKGTRDRLRAIVFVWVHKEGAVRLVSLCAHRQKPGEEVESLLMCAAGAAVHGVRSVCVYTLREGGALLMACGRDRKKERLCVYVSECVCAFGYMHK